ncbi:unnamed protein product [Caenorhabditis bovis]|uniref:Lipid droplet-associated hydrolase n=1 Tax=Caenorhabditis bovis TaxID=2654633 RepID=A0A8S1F9B6_9PELO|nr:unnamed protein product [Caenorhabditis bovis]
MSSNRIQRIVKWVPVAGKMTRISIMGEDVGENCTMVSNLGAAENRVVILMIPGNPGNEGFYAHFGRELLNNILKEQHSRGRRFLFYTVSSLNHVRMPDELQRVGEHENHDLFSLDEQVDHKLNFVRQFLPRAQQIYIFGHSIGSYMMLRILPQVIADGFNVVKAVALFPTIERMAESPNGKRLGSTLAVLSRHDWLAKLLSFWVDFMPTSMRKFLVRLNLRDPSIPTEIVDAATEIVGMNVFRNIVHMSNDELEQVVELDESLIEHNDRIHFYYGVKDGWCPIRHGRDMLERLGDEHVTLDEHDCEHAFVIKEGEIVARIVADYFH